MPAIPLLPAELAIVIPTRDERDNIAPLLARLEAVLVGVAWEVVFVDDDSRDGTVVAVRSVAARDPRVRCLQRIGRRGLASACIEGWAATSAPYLAVMDADLQHDENLLPVMLARLRDNACDLVVGSRYVDGGSVGQWGGFRRTVSRLGTTAGQRLLRVTVADSMSGFFMLRREVFEASMYRLTGTGFKILLDLLASAPPALRVQELPFTFRPREAGESKLDTLVVLEFGQLLVHKLTGGFLPVRFGLFLLVGGVGVVVHLAVLGILLHGAQMVFWSAQAVATAAAMVGNYLLNNSLTHRDRRHRGLGLVLGLAAFGAVCAVGAVANVRMAVFLYELGAQWWLAGVGGAAVGSVWNYAVSAHLVWHRR